MGLKIYDYRGSTYQFEEGQEPEGAVLAKAAPQPANKGRAPKNKAGKPSAAELKAKADEEAAAAAKAEEERLAAEAEAERLAAEKAAKDEDAGSGVESATDPNASEV